MGLICERKPERDGRRTRSAELAALKASNAALKAEVCALHALVYALRSSTHPELTYQMLTAPVRESHPNDAHAMHPELLPDAQLVQNSEAGGTANIAPQAESTALALEEGATGGSAVPHPPERGAVVAYEPERVASPVIVGPPPPPPATWADAANGFRVPALLLLLCNEMPVRDPLPRPSATSSATRQQKRKATKRGPRPSSSSSGPPAALPHDAGYYPAALTASNLALADALHARPARPAPATTATDDDAVTSSDIAPAERPRLVIRIPSLAARRALALAQPPPAAPPPPPPTRKRSRSPTPDEDEDEFAASFMRKRRVAAALR
ncbi:hypothetical protein AURDEDRAFT_161794 [Auricularia subglabra TFB-10046 SS5]|nr:hypothetical protein AURDEDRAFT_161794 [Auricularia subglabra TFB-10046 SS5]